MDVREKVVELVGQVQDCGCDVTDAVAMNYVENITLVDHLIANGVTVQEWDGCEYCKEDNEGYRKMIGAFSITNPFHGNLWIIETCHCKPRQIYFCPMCGRKLPQPPKGE